MYTLMMGEMRMCNAFSANLKDNKCELHIYIYIKFNTSLRLDCHTNLMETSNMDSNCYLVKD